MRLWLNLGVKPASELISMVRNHLLSGAMNQQFYKFHHLPFSVENREQWEDTDTDDLNDRSDNQHWNSFICLDHDLSAFWIAN